MGGPPRARGRRGFGGFRCLGITLKYSLPHRLSCVGRNPCMSGVFSLGLEQRVGYDVQITELREGRTSGPPRSRGRRGVGVFGRFGITLQCSLPHRLSCVGRNPCMSGVFSLGIGTAGRIRCSNILTKAGSVGRAPACARETGFRRV